MIFSAGIVSYTGSVLFCSYPCPLTVPSLPFLTLLKVVQLALLQSCLSLGLSCADLLTGFSSSPLLSSSSGREGARGAEGGTPPDGPLGADSATCVNEGVEIERERGRERETEIRTETGRGEGKKEDGREDGAEGEIQGESQHIGILNSDSRPRDPFSTSISPSASISMCVLQGEDTEGERSCPLSFSSTPPVLVKGQEAVPTGLRHIMTNCWLVLYVLTSTVIWVLIVLYSAYNRYSETDGPSTIKRLDITSLWSVAFAPAGAVLRYSLWHVPVLTPYVTRKIPSLKVPTLVANVLGTLFFSLCTVLAPHSLYSLAFTSGECAGHGGNITVLH